MEVGGIGRPTNTGDDDSLRGGRWRAEASRTSGVDGGADKVWPVVTELEETDRRRRPGDHGGLA